MNREKPTFSTQLKRHSGSFRNANLTAQAYDQFEYSTPAAFDMEIDTSIKRKLYRSATNFAFNLIVILAMDTGMLFVAHNEFIQGNIFEAKGLVAIIFLSIFLPVTLVLFHQATNFNKKPWLILSPEGFTYVHQYWFVPWYAVTRIEVIVTGRYRFSFPSFLNSKFAVFDFEDSYYNENPRVFANKPGKSAKFIESGDFCILLNGYKTPRDQIEQMIRAYAKAHGAPATKDRD